MQASAKRSNGRHYAAARQTGGLGPGRGDAVVAERGHAGISHGGEGHLMSWSLPTGQYTKNSFRHATRRSGCCSRSEEHTSELQSLMRISYAVFCLKKNKTTKTKQKK